MITTLSLPPAPFVYRGIQVHLDSEKGAHMWWFIDHRGRTLAAASEEEVRAEIDIMHFVITRVQRVAFDADAVLEAAA